jgi:hypothetical protein
MSNRSGTPLGALLAIALVPTYAQAGWQYTQWGMTAEEIVAASKGAAHPASGKAKPDKLGATLIYHLLDADYVGSGYEFAVNFWFDENRRLATVTLKLKNPADCASLHGTLSGIYGPPVNERYPRWWDSSNGNVVLLTDIAPTLCDLSYRPYVKPGKTGGL